MKEPRQRTGTEPIPGHLSAAPESSPPAAPRTVRSAAYIGLACFAGAFLLYLATWMRVQPWDSIAYTARALGNPLLSERFLSTAWFHPHHLLYVPLAALFGHVLPPGDAGPLASFAPLLLLSSLAGAGCVGLAGWIAHRATGRRSTAVFAAAALALTNAVWIYSTIVEVMMPALCFLLLGVALAFGRSHRHAVAAGLAIGLAVLLHQIVVLFAVALTLALALPARGALRRPGSARRFAAAWIALAVGVYAWAAVAHQGLRSPVEIARWTLAAGERSESSRLSLAGMAWQSARTLCEALITQTPVARRADPAAWPWMLAITLVLAVLAGGMVLAWRRRNAAGSSPDAGVALRGLAWGALATAAFIAWFQPRTLDYWVYVVACLMLLAGIGAMGSRGAGGRVGALAWPALVLLGGVNFGYRALPALDPENAPYADLLRFSAGRLRAGDCLWIGPRDASLEDALVALPFFAQVDTRVAGNDRAPWMPGGLARGAPRSGARPAAPCAGRVFATANALAQLEAQRGERIAAEPQGSMRGVPVFRLGERAGIATPARPDTLSGGTAP